MEARDPLDQQAVDMDLEVDPVDLDLDQTVEVKDFLLVAADNKVPTVDSVEGTPVQTVDSIQETVDSMEDNLDQTVDSMVDTLDPTVVSIQAVILDQMEDHHQIQTLDMD